MLISLTHIALGKRESILETMLISKMLTLACVAFTSAVYANPGHAEKKPELAGAAKPGTNNCKTPALLYKNSLVSAVESLKNSRTRRSNLTDSKILKLEKATEELELHLIASLKEFPLNLDDTRCWDTEEKALTKKILAINKILDL